MKDMKKVRLSLENCECLEFTNEQVEYFAITDIKKNLHWADGNLYEMNTCDSFSIELMSSANISENSDSNFSDSQLPFDRLLQYPDVVSIEVFYSDGSSLDIYVDWNDDNSRDSNSYQSTMINDEGNLCIVVDKNATVESVFDTLMNRANEERNPLQGEELLDESIRLLEEYKTKYI